MKFELEREFKILNLKRRREKNKRKREIPRLGPKATNSAHLANSSAQPNCDVVPTGGPIRPDSQVARVCFHPAHWRCWSTTQPLSLLPLTCADCLSLTCGPISDSRARCRGAGVTDTPGPPRSAHLLLPRAHGGMTSMAEPRFPALPDPASNARILEYQLGALSQPNDLTGAQAVCRWGIGDPTTR